jgi:hypothetical protein
MRVSHKERQRERYRETDRDTDMPELGSRLCFGRLFIHRQHGLAEALLGCLSLVHLLLNGARAASRVRERRRKK